MTTNHSTELAATQRGLGDDVLANINGFDSALAALENAGIGYESISDYGTGFSVTDKEKLVGVPFIALEWRFNTGDFGSFVSAAIVTKTGQKLILNDGSTGIREQFQMVSAKRSADGHKSPQAGLMVPNGLSVSNYNYTDEKGEVRPARTYYLSETPAAV